MQALERPGDDVDNSWPAYRHMVLSGLDRLEERDKYLNEKLDKIIRMQEKLSLDVASLQAKSGIFGMLGGLIPAVVALAMILIGGYWRGR
jgi:hypothetical protein